MGPSAACPWPTRVDLLWRPQVGFSSPWSYCVRMCALIAGKLEWGAQTIIFTEISRDGTGEGINLPLYEKLNQLDCDIVASGGVASLADIKGLKQLGISGVIVGKSLYNGSLQLADVLAAGEAEA